MLGLAVKIVDHTQRVADAAKKAGFRNFGHAAARLRKTAVESIEPSDEPSAPGSPPHTRRRVSRKGKALKGQLQRAIVYDADAEGAVIGPRASVIGESGQAHEFGGEYKGGDFPERPFMLPALEAHLDRFAAEWGGSIGE